MNFKKFNEPWLQVTLQLDFVISFIFHVHALSSHFSEDLIAYNDGQLKVREAIEGKNEESNI